MSSKKTKQLVARLRSKAMKISFKIKYQQTGLLEVVEHVEIRGDDFLRSPEWRALRKMAIARYGSTCVKCGRVGSKKYPINIDHIKPRKYYPELALDINNLQPLCGSCNKRKGNKVEPLGKLLSKQNESEWTMTQDEINEPAFPTNDVCYNGITIRDYFAAKAMQATFGSPIESTAEGKKYIAMHAYKMADAMLEARK